MLMLKKTTTKTKINKKKGNELFYEKFLFPGHHFCISSKLDYFFFPPLWGWGRGRICGGVWNISQNPYAERVCVYTP